MRTDSLEKVLEKLATSDKVTIVIERQPDGKMRRRSFCAIRCYGGTVSADAGTVAREAATDTRNAGRYT